MTKIEFLAASLPYGLKCNLIGEYIKGTEFDDKPSMKVLIIGGIEYQAYCDNRLEIECTDDDYIYNVPIEEVFPIIRHLDTLTQECVQADYNDGKPFIPIAKLFGMPSEEIEIKYKDEFSIEFKNKRNRCFYSLHIPSISLKDAQYLLQWHFWPNKPEGEEGVYISDEFNPYK